MQYKPEVSVSTDEYLKTYYTFRVGDIAFEGHPSKEFKFGRFVENDIGDGIVSHIFAVFRPIVEYDLYFWKYAINNEVLMQRPLSRSTKASTMMHDLVTNDFLNESFAVPSIAEQKKIGRYFKELDNLITLHQRNNNAFSRNVTFVWEQRKLGDELEFLKDGTHGTHQNADKGPYLLSAKNIKNGQIIIDDESDRKISQEAFEQIHAKFELQKGDVLLTIVGSIGETAILENTGNFTFQRSVAFLRPGGNLTSVFLKTEIDSDQFQKELCERKSQSAQPGVYLGDLAKIPVYITSRDEQNKIGQYFKNLDMLITLHQYECRLSQQIKCFTEFKCKPINGCGVKSTEKHSLKPSFP